MTNAEIITTIVRLFIGIAKRQKSYKKDDIVLMTLCKQLESNGAIDSAESLFEALTR